jgi:protein-L-isoaspartate(D-aspartate) O-methyltransferase
MTAMNIEEARFNMIEQQIRPWEVLDQTVLDVIAKLRREAFVPQPFHTLAFADTNIPIGHGEVMLAPKVEARLLQALALQPTDTVLEVGTGSGYFTAMLASLARHVYSVELHAEFCSGAAQRLEEQGIYNISLEQGDAASGWAKHAPYAAIAITGSLPILPDAFKQQLKIGGRLVVILGDAPVMTAQLITRVGEHEWRSEELFETSVPPLQNAIQPNRFTL